MKSAPPLLTLLCVLAGCATVQGTRAEDEALRTLEREIDRRAAMDSFSGVVLVARHGRVVFHAERGLANKSFDVANRLDTKFYIASLTKMFTGVAVAQLAQAGRLRFSDRVTAYVPGLPVGDTAVTIHHLLTHTSGLGSIWTDAFQRSNHAMYRTTADYLPLALNAERRFAPGTSYHYSNAGFVLLGAVIERVTGMSYREYVREHVFRAAGMMSSMEDDVEVPIAGRAVPYTPANWTMPAHKGWTSAELIGLANMFSAGGAVSTAPDLLNVAIALQQHRLLNAAYADTVTRGVATVNASTTYAYGFFNRTIRGHRVIYHSGGAEGINAHIDMVPDLDLVVVILSNYDPPATAALVGVARQALLR